MFASMKSRSHLKLGLLYQKLCHQAESKENLNTLMVLFFQEIMNLAQNVYLDDLGQV